MTTFVGSHKAMQSVRSSDAVAVIFIMTLGAMFLGRWLLEGLPYQVSLSATIGDTAGFIYVILRAQEVLKRPGIQIPELLQRRDVHVWILMVGFVICILGCFLSLRTRQGQIMDIYHDVFIAPMFIYLGFTLVPVILANGTRKEMYEAGSYITLWLSLAAFDWYTGMIAQRPWLTEHFHLVWPVHWWIFIWTT